MPTYRVLTVPVPGGWRAEAPAWPGVACEDETKEGAEAWLAERLAAAVLKARGKGIEPPESDPDGVRVPDAKTGVRRGAGSGPVAWRYEARSDGDSWIYSFPDLGGEVRVRGGWLRMAIGTGASAREADLALRGLLEGRLARGLFIPAPTPPAAGESFVLLEKPLIHNEDPNPEDPLDLIDLENMGAHFVGQWIKRVGEKTLLILAASDTAVLAAVRGAVSKRRGDILSELANGMVGSLKESAIVEAERFGLEQMAKMVSDGWFGGAPERSAHQRLESRMRLMDRKQRAGDRETAPTVEIEW